MSLTNTISDETVPSPFQLAWERTRDLLRTKPETLFDQDHPLVGALKVAVSEFGVEKIHGHGPLDGESFEVTLDRLCKGTGLLVRPVSFANLENFNAPCPVIVCRKADQQPVAVVQKGRTWLAIDPLTGSKTSLAKVAHDFETTAYLISPAFPDRKIKPSELVCFGLFRARFDLAGYLLLMTLTGLVAAMLPIVSQWVVQDILPGHETMLMAQVVMFLVLLFGANLVTRLAASLAQLRIDGRTGSMLRFAAADRCVRICSEGEHPPPPPVAAFAARSMATWHQGIWHLLLTLVASFLIAAPSLAVVASSAPLAAILVLLAICVMLGCAMLIARQQYKAMMKGRASPMSWMTGAFETLSEIETVRSYSAEQTFFARWSDSFLGLREKFLRGDRTTCGLHAINAALEAVLILVAITGIFIFHSKTSTAETVAFVMAVTTIAGTMAALVSACTHVSMLALQKRLITPLLEGQFPIDRNTRRIADISGGISVNNICYRHHKNGPLALDQVSIEAAPGEHIGIAGPSGAGKSTLLRILLGMEAPESGQVLFDQNDLSEMDASELRRKIGVVGQAGKLLPGSLFDNIALGKTITRAEAWHALRLAGLEEDVAQMPLGLATPIGDANPTLSGGQIQRVLLARAFASKPKLIVLDEATSALDPQAQRRVQGALEQSQATVISITHRLETLRNCNRIYVMDGGRVVECGDFQTLQSAGGLFAGLVNVEQNAVAPARNVAQDALNRILRELGPKPA